jgi:hypothetical protein
LLKVWPALSTFTEIDGIQPTNNPAERALAHRSSTAKSRSERKATLENDSPSARSPPPAHVA